MSSVENGMTWYLAQLKPNAAGIAERNLARQGFRTFMPMDVRTSRTEKGFRTRQRPLFPGYIFLSLDHAAGHWRTVNSTSGITRLVSFGRDPAPVPRGIVDSLIEQFDDSGTQAETPEVKPGEKVRIGNGPFADFLARVLDVAPDQRVWVLLDLMGRQTRLAVPTRALRHV